MGVVAVAVVPSSRDRRSPPPGGWLLAAAAPLFCVADVVLIFAAAGAVLASVSGQKRSARATKYRSRKTCTGLLARYTRRCGMKITRYIPSYWIIPWVSSRWHLGQRVSISDTISTRVA